MSAGSKWALHIRSASSRLVSSGRILKINIFRLNSQIVCLLWRICVGTIELGMFWVYAVYAGEAHAHFAVFAPFVFQGL